MALWVCKTCGCKFAVGLTMCPQCTGTDVEEDSELPKITSSGPSNAAADEEAAREKEAKSSGGISSSKRTSSQKTEASKAETSKPKSARMTASPSKKDQADSSTAPSTDTDQAD